MQLCLLRHGPAVEREDWRGSDADRPLTNEGVSTTRTVVALLKPLISAHEVLTSPYLRARHTAELAATSWRLPLAEAAWLACEASDEAGQVALIPRRDCCLVGHEPDLGMLLGYLLGGPPIPLKKAGFAILEGTLKPRGMQLRTLLAPKAVLGLAGR